MNKYKQVEAATTIIVAMSVEITAGAPAAKVIMNTAVKAAEQEISFKAASAALKEIKAI